MKRMVVNANQIVPLKTMSCTIEKAKMSYSSGSGKISYDEETFNKIASWFFNVQKESENGKKIVSAKIIISLSNGTSLNLDPSFQNGTVITQASLTAVTPYFQSDPSIQTISYFASYDTFQASLDAMISNAFGSLESISYEVLYI